jgi:hypothetical protein
MRCDFRKELSDCATWLRGLVKRRPGCHYVRHFQLLSCQNALHGAEFISSINAINQQPKRFRRCEAKASFEARKGQQNQLRRVDDSMREDVSRKKNARASGRPDDDDVLLTLKTVFVADATSG